MSAPLKEDFIQKMKDRKAKNGASPGQVNPPPVTAAAPAASTNKLAAKLAARKAAEQQTATAPVPEPEPDPLPAAEEEAPKAGRGRPRGSKNAATAAAPKPPSPSDQWVAFASLAAPVVLGTMSDEDMLDPEMQEGVAQTVAGFADALLKEYLGRFGV